MSCQRFGCKRAFRDDATALGDISPEFFILGRINDINPTGDNRDCSTVKGGQMRCRIDAARKAGDDNVSFCCDFC